MPEVAINIGDKKFTVTCQPGEESALEAAASLLNDEASFLISEIGQLSEQKLLLMSGLMLADKMTSQSEKLGKAEKAGAEQLFPFLTARFPLFRFLHFPLLPRADRVAVRSVCRPGGLLEKAEKLKRLGKAGKS